MFVVPAKTQVRGLCSVSLAYFGRMVSTVEVMNALMPSTSLLRLVASSSAISMIHMPRSFSAAASPSSVLKLSQYQSERVPRRRRNMDLPSPCAPCNTGM